MVFPLFRHVSACNALDLTGISTLSAEGRVLAWPAAAAQSAMAEFPEAFHRGATGWTFVESCDTPARRTAALARVASTLRERGAIRGLRGESYAVTTEWGAPVAATLDRGASVAMGIRAFGVHLNGYVRRPDGLHLWVGRRAADKAVAPGKLDNMVAGGQPAGLGLFANLIKECGEEASLPAALARRAVPVGLVRYCFSTPEGVKPDTLFCYDLEMPADAIPTPGDDECQEFMLWPVAKVLDILAATDDFKFNVPLVILDFALRHGVLDPDASAEYTAIAAGLRRDFPDARS